MPETLIDVAESLQHSSKRIIFPEREAVIAQKDVPGLAAGIAARLCGLIDPGEPVGLLTATEPSFVPGLFGILAAAGSVTVLPAPPVVLDPGQAADHLTGIVDTARLCRVLVSTAMLPVATELSRLRPHLQLTNIGEVRPTTWPGRPAQVRPDSLAIIQFTSGSTGRPKGVMLSHAAVLAGINGIRTRFGTTPEDVFMQWVPLFHDLGLIGLLTALTEQVDTHLFTPLTFVKNTAWLLECMARDGCTVTTGPNFGFERLAAAASLAGIAPGALRKLRLAISGGETIRLGTVETFEKAFAPLGVPGTTMAPCYGMAEATLAITAPRMRERPHALHISRAAERPGGPVTLVAPGTPGARAAVCVGVPMPGLELQIVDSQRRHLDELQLGQIEVRGASLTSGYLHDPDTTQAVIRDGWLATGDLGFLCGGELYITGRSKEMIVVRGHNYFPDDVEDLARRTPGIHRRHAIAFADQNREQIVIVAEAATQDRASLATRIEREVASHLGLAAVRAILVDPNGLPRTTSGKWRRAEVRRLYEGGPPDG
jgi:fatty-acyl-CoA synthase